MVKMHEGSIVHKNKKKKIWRVTMVKVYTSYNCSSCKKVITWFDEQGIEYEEHNFFSKSLTEDELREILHSTEKGFEDIVSERSKVFVTNKSEIESMSIHELINFIIDHPSILKRPIIMDETTNIFKVGYNKYDMQDFL